MNPQYKSLCLTSCRSVCVCVPRDTRKQNRWVVSIRLAGKSEVQGDSWNRWQMAELGRLVCYIGKWRLFRTVSDHLSWWNKKAKCLLNSRRTNYRSPYKKESRQVFKSSWLYLYFSERCSSRWRNPGMWAVKVLMYTPIGPPVWVVWGPSL